MAKVIIGIVIALLLLFVGIIYVLTRKPDA
jgi:hypothetical protein